MIEVYRPTQGELDAEGHLARHILSAATRTAGYVIDSRRRSSDDPEASLPAHGMDVIRLGLAMEVLLDTGFDTQAAFSLSSEDFAALHARVDKYAYKVIQKIALDES